MGRAEAVAGAVRLRWEWWLFTAALFLAPFLAGQFGFSIIASEDLQKINFLPGGSGVPEIGYLIIGLLVMTPLVVTAWKSPVARFPQGWILSFLCLFWVWLLLSIVSSDFRAAGWRELGIWTVSLSAFVLAASTLGRGRYALAFAGIIALAGCLEAAVAIREYAESFRGDPNWRVFGTFFNPDFLACYLAMATPLCIAFLAHVRGSLSPILRLLAFLPLPALVLTGSRGGLIAAGVGIGSFLALSAWNRSLDRRVAIAVAVSTLIAIGTFGLVSSQGGGGRLAPGSSQEAHSGSFRLHLWQDAKAMIQAKPMAGFGLGSYPWARTEFATVGFTRLAHNTFIQLATESGVASVVVLFALFLAWGRRTFPREASGEVPGEELLGLRAPLIRSAAVAGVLAALVHNMIDSQAYLFANNLTMWGLMGLALALAVDGTMPVRVPEPALGLMGSAIAIFALTLVGRMAIGANYASSAQAAVVRRELSAAEEGFANAVYWQPSDRRYLLAYGGLLNWARDSKKAKEQVKAAVAAEPSADAYVGAGRLYLAMREPEDAERSFRAALEKDPYSPTAEMELLDLYRTAGRNEQMVALARKVAAQRETTYATTRAVPEMVETIYSEANLILAKEGDDRDRRLQEAFEDLDSYMRTTYPIYLRRGQYSGITDEQAAKNRDMYLSSVKASLAIRRDDTLEPWQRHVSDMFKKTVESVFNVYLDLKRHDDASQWTEDTNAVHPKLPT